ncbi:MAG: Uma2 family endonuclease [Saprospiraceae bacterium]|nr:Uma2 family endonuclease [Saprospiraceae bacterium]
MKITKIDFAKFEKRYLSKEDRFKYEWVDGLVVKTVRMFTQSNLYIFFNLTRKLEELNAKGRFYTEVETWFENSYRSPNISFFTEGQAKLFGKVNQVPSMVTELISDDCPMNAYNEKLIDYRNAKVPIVWFVFPKTKEVHVYRGKQMTICTGDDICSAEPVIPGFLIAANAVFS